MQLFSWSSAWGITSIDPSCLAVQTYLRACQVPFVNIPCNNPAISQYGKLPVLKDEEFTVVGCEAILQHLINKGHTLGHQTDFDVPKSIELYTALFEELNRAWAFVLFGWGENLEVTMQLLHSSLPRYVRFFFSSWMSESTRQQWRPTIHEAKENIDVLRDNARKKLEENSAKAKNQSRAPDNSKKFIFSFQETLKNQRDQNVLEQSLLERNLVDDYVLSKICALCEKCFATLQYLLKDNPSISPTLPNKFTILEILIYAYVAPFIRSSLPRNLIGSSLLKFPDLKRLIDKFDDAWLPLMPQQTYHWRYVDIYKLRHSLIPRIQVAKSVKALPENEQNQTALDEPDYAKHRGWSVAAGVAIVFFYLTTKIKIVIVDPTMQ